MVKASVLDVALGRRCLIALSLRNHPYPFTCSTSSVLLDVVKGLALAGGARALQHLDNLVVMTPARDLQRRTTIIVHLVLVGTRVDHMLL